MIRSLLVFALLFIVYQALKTVFSSARKEYHKEDRQTRIMGDEIVLDPECRTYVVKDRAVTRNIRGTISYFCSDTCARHYEDRNRS